MQYRFDPDFACGRATLVGSNMLHCFLVLKTAAIENTICDSVLKIMVEISGT